MMNIIPYNTDEGSLDNPLGGESPVSFGGYEINSDGTEANLPLVGDPCTRYVNDDVIVPSARNTIVLDRTDCEALGLPINWT